MSSVNGEKTTFKVKTTTKFSKIMKIYCDRFGLGLKAVRFLFDGTVIKESDTPQSLGIEDED